LVSNKPPGVVDATHRILAAASRLGFLKNKKSRYATEAGLSEDFCPDTSPPFQFFHFLLRFRFLHYKNLFYHFFFQQELFTTK
jgi:hypothetical protein